jgi:hypothetical protein
MMVLESSSATRSRAGEDTAVLDAMLDRTARTFCEFEPRIALERRCPVESDQRRLSTYKPSVIDCRCVVRVSMSHLAAWCSKTLVGHQQCRCTVGALFWCQNV